MARLVTLVIPFLALAACQKEDPRYCDQHHGQDGCPIDAPGTGPACSAKADCKTAELPVCDTAKENGTCVACTASDRGACGGDKPRCENDGCVACVDDGDCPDSVCLPGGACADAATVVHAVPKGGATTPDCGLRGAGACTLEAAITNARTKGPTVIKLDTATTDVTTTYLPDGNNLVIDGAVTLDLRVGATISHRSGSDGAAIAINSPGKLTLLGGTITGGHGTSGDGVACNTGGTLVVDQTHFTGNDASAINTTSCTVTVTRVLIDDNNKAGDPVSAIRISRGSITLARSTIVGNRGGGLDVNSNATFTVIGNAFAGNGGPAANVGGIAISTTTSGNRLDFNSISENKAQDGLAAGLTCAANAGFIAANNIIWSNNSALLGTSIQISGSCKHRYSDIGPTVPVGFDAATNKNTNPMFVNASSDLHLTATSPVSDLAADPQADLTGTAALDLDGDPRTSPATIGADQPRTK